MVWEVFQQVDRKGLPILDDLTGTRHKVTRYQLRRTRRGLCLKCLQPRAITNGKLRLRCEFHLKDDLQKSIARQAKKRSSATESQRESK